MSNENRSVEKLHRENEKLRRELDLASGYSRQREAALQEMMIRLQKLLETSLTLEGSELQASLDKCTSQSAGLLNADAATLDIRSADGKALFYPVSHNLPQGLLTLRHLPRGEDLSWEEVESGRSILVNEYPASPKARQELVDSGVRALMAVPIRAGRACLGALAFYRLENLPNFSELDLSLAENIALQMGRAVHSQLLLQEVEQLRGVDPITKFYKHHLFHDLAQHDVERVFRYGGYISVIMVEIDNLAQVQSFYGEGTTNQLLGEVAQMWREKLRTSDVLGRFEQDRLLMLLPEADRQSARLTAERMRREIENAVFNTDSGPLKLTISLGIASSKRGKKIGAEKLIRRAEQVLAAAIRSGRNQVETWNPESDEE